MKNEPTRSGASPTMLSMKTPALCTLTLPKPNLPAASFRPDSEVAGFQAKKARDQPMRAFVEYHTGKEDQEQGQRGRVLRACKVVDGDLNVNTNLSAQPRQEE